MRLTLILLGSARSFDTARGRIEKRKNWAEGSGKLSDY